METAYCIITAATPEGLSEAVAHAQAAGYECRGGASWWPPVDPNADLAQLRYAQTMVKSDADQLRTIALNMANEAFKFLHRSTGEAAEGDEWKGGDRAGG